jgi:TolB-like protein
MSMLRRAAAAVLVAGLAAAPAGAQQPTVAVLDFTNSAIGTAHAELAPLASGISDLLAGELAASGQVRLVERKAVRQLLDEQALVAGQQVDVATAIRVGKLLGAQHVILGGFVTDRNGQMQLHARAVNMETGVIEHVERVSDRTENFMPLVARLAKQMNAGLKLPPAPVRAEAAPTPAPVRETSAAPAKGAPFQAVLLYSRAVNAEDAGDRQTAVELYSQTLTRFPEYAPARRALDRIEASGDTR